MGNGTTEQRAQWEWVADETTASTRRTRLCDVCLRMKINVELQRARPSESDVEQAGGIANWERRFVRRRAERLLHHGYTCDRFAHTGGVVPATEILAYSLRDCSARHAMIFTKANAALPLLFSLNLVQRDTATVVFPALEQAATRSSANVQQMMRIKACMRDGRTLILVRARHLYESLLDALNLHYTAEGEGQDRVFRTWLSMGGLTQAVLIRPSFRCIVIEDQDEIQSCLLPPMINRFTKESLTFASALTDAQRCVRDALRTSAEVQVEGKPLNILHLLVPGYSQHTLDSLAYLSSEDVADQERALSDRLMLTFSPKAARRIEIGLVEGLVGADSVVVSRWIDGHAELIGEKDFVTIARQALDSFGAHHLFVMTEQGEIDSRLLASAIADIFNQEEEAIRTRFSSATALNLNQASVDDYTIAIRDLQIASLGENECCICLCTLDTGNSDPAQLEAFLHVVERASLSGNRHVVLIAAVSDPVASAIAGRGAPRFHLTFDAAWCHLFADEVVVTQPSLPVESFHAPLAAVLDVELAAALLCLHDRSVLLAQQLSALADPQYIRDCITRLFANSGAGRPPAAGIVVIQTIVDSIASLGCTEPQWSRLALQKCPMESLRQTYLEFMGRVVSRVFLLHAPMLFSYRNIELALDADTTPLFLYLLQQPGIVPVYDARACLNVNLVSPVQWKPVEAYGGFRWAPESQLSFPFSPFLFRLFHAPGVTGEHTDQHIAAHVTDAANSPLPTISGPALQAYIRDVIALGKGLSNEHFQFFVALAEKFGQAPFQASFSAFHAFLVQERPWFDVCLQLVRRAPLARISTFPLQMSPAALLRVFSNSSLLIDMQDLPLVEKLCRLSPDVP
eukprot:TRINITY_DN24755_c0_g1_i1.p1 TRINITY_DN24755_c0_g1~~TRINITY_DN24755_c0_g1_i1.p1  ORF type:complete len:857 (-),score=138.60 TRINITY_DN24755_c0_g1_i1:3-2573(-)